VVAMGLMEILILLLIAFFLIGVPMVIVSLVIYVSTRQRNTSTHFTSHVKKEIGEEVESGKGSKS
jgi:hypothetical protein